MALKNMNSLADINIAVIGLGMMGSIASHVFEQGTGRVRAIIGRNDQEITDYVAANHFPDLSLTGTFEDYDALLNQTDVPINVVYVATPNFMHAGMGIKAAEAGKHLLFEKPLATSIEDARKVVAACVDNKVAADINSQYRFADVVNFQLREMINTGKFTGNDGGVVEMGKPISVEEGYIQGWQYDPAMNIGWRPIISLAGKGKLTGDLGSHEIMMTHHLFDGEFTSFSGTRFNVYEYRNLVLSGQGVAFSHGTGGEQAERVRMDDIKFSGDDRATADWKYKISGGHEITGKYLLSQVDPGNENHFYVKIKFEKGEVAWFQERPNQLYYTKGGQTYVLERQSSPSISGRPGGHNKGYGEMVLDESLGLFDTIRTGDKARYVEFTKRNMGHAQDTVAKVIKWNETPLKYGVDSSNIVNKDMEYHTFVAQHAPMNK